MTIHRRIFGRLAISTILLAIPFGPAFAQDAAAIADRLKAALAVQGIDISWTGVSGDASSLVLQAVTLKPTGEAEGLPIGDVTLAGVTEEAGAYAVETLTTAPFSKTADGMTLDLSAFIVNGLTIPAAGETDPLAAFMLYETAELASMSVKAGDKTAFALNGLGFEVNAPEGAPLEFTGSAESFTADLTLVKDPQSKAVIDALGYQTINGDFEMAGSWQPADGRLDLSQYDITVEDAGTIGMTFDFGGYTLDFIKSMQELSAKMAAQPAGGEDSATGLAMLGLMQQLTVSSAAVRFDDDSLTGKVLNYVASQQGAQPADIANQAKAIVPFLTGQLNNPELAAQITAAVTAYLDDPQNIEIAAAPPAPVPFALLMAGAMSNPMDLTKTLGVKVTANQP
jgi:hypothetical protein